MRKIGLLGGLSCEGTALYYERINALVRSRLGGLNTADILISSANFALLMQHRRAGSFELVADILADRAEWLIRGGAEIVLICADPMHMVVPMVAARIRQVSPRARLIDAVEETSRALQMQGCARPLLLAMQNFTEHEAYVERLQRDGMAVQPLNVQDCELVRRIVLEELCAGQVRFEARDRMLDVMERGIMAGADSVIFACPEISILLDPSDLLCPGFDSAALQAEAAVEYALTTMP